MADPEVGSEGLSHVFGVPSSSTLPSDLVRGGSRRLSALALLTTVMAALGLLVSLPTFGGTALEWARLVLFITVVLFSAGCAAAARWVTLDADQLYRAGVLYMVVIALAVGILRHSDPWTAETRGISAIAMLILLFPVIVPCSPRRAWLAAGTATLASAAGFAATLIAGNPVPDLGHAVQIFRGELLSTAVAGLVASVVYGMGRKLERARQLGAYELQQRLGQGGMGEVWRAKHRLLARPAAVKLISPDAQMVTDGRANDALVRFEREVQATSGLRNPHTVEVYDFGIAEDGTFYYVMELLDGIDLHRFVTRFGPMEAERVVYVLRQACRSLSEAHNQGLVHRDVKPSNLLLCHYGDEFDFAKVLDFGLVTPTRPQSADARLTMIGQVTGTPAFMSSEQAKGEIRLDARSDVYAVGCIAYWLLTGQLVFDGDTSMEIVAKHITEAPVPPSERTPQPIPPELEALVMSCLAKDPDQRPQSARALADALDAVPLDDPWTEDRAMRWWSQHMNVLAPGPSQPDPETVQLLTTRA